MPSERRQAGDRGELVAKEYLEENGYKIIKENFHFGRTGELDIIAEKNDILVFVEVRSKFSENTLNPLLSLTQSKRRKIRKSAEGYLYINKIQNKMCRIDFLIVDFSTTSDKPVIQHLENIA